MFHKVFKCRFGCLEINVISLTINKFDVVNINIVIRVAATILFPNPE